MSRKLFFEDLPIVTLPVLKEDELTNFMLLHTTLIFLY